VNPLPIREKPPMPMKRTKRTCRASPARWRLTPRVSSSPGTPKPVPLSPSTRSVARSLERLLNTYW